MLRSPRTDGRRERALRLAGRIAAAGSAVVLLLAAVVVLPALTAPGNDGVAARVAESARDHGLGFVVTGLEAVQYRLHPPRDGGSPDPGALRSLAVDRSSGVPSLPLPAEPPRSSAPTPRSSGPSPPAGAPPHEARGGQIGMQPAIPPVATPGLPGEGVYTPKVMVRGRPALQVALLRPDQTHTSYLSGVAWMSGDLLRFVQHPGSTDPGPVAPWGQPATVAADARLGLAATFNSGFKIRDSRGAF